MIDIYIVGLGIVSVDQVTREAERAIRRSNHVLYADTGVGTRAWLLERCPRVTDLYHHSYGEHEARLDAYHHMAAAVIDAALDHPPVTFAMHGHPLVFSYPPFLVRDLAAVLGLKVQIQPGISATAALLCDLGVDPCTTGMQMYEATDLLVHRRPLAPDVPALIWQVGNVETRLHTLRVSKPERLFRLRDHLLRFYPPDHVATAVYSSPHPIMRSTVHHLAIGDLAQWAEILHIGYTLYIPAAAHRPVADPELLRQIDDPAHLARITRGGEP